MLEIYYDTYEKVYGLPIDIIGYLEDYIWKILQYNNLPTIRQYQEIFALGFIRQYPEKTFPYIEKQMGNRAINTQFLISLSFVKTISKFS